MRRKGYDFKLANHLTYRFFNPETDVDRCVDYDAEYFERSPHDSYVVIIPVKACLDENGDFQEELRQAAQPIKFDNWSRTNMVYGAGWRKQTRGTRHWVRFADLEPDEKAALIEFEHDHPGCPQVRWDNEEGEAPDGWHAKWFDTYWTSTIYWVENGRVYTATTRRMTDPTIKLEAEAA